MYEREKASTLVPDEGETLRACENRFLQTVFNTEKRTADTTMSSLESSNRQ
jgi:hypothetical protein